MPPRGRKNLKWKMKLKARKAAVAPSNGEGNKGKGKRQKEPQDQAELWNSAGPSGLQAPVPGTRVPAEKTSNKKDRRAPLPESGPVTDYVYDEFQMKLKEYLWEIHLNSILDKLNVNASVLSHDTSFSSMYSDD